MLMETTLLFKTLVILSGELFLMLSVCFYCLNRARRAYESNSSFLGLYFRGAVNMKGQLDLIPYGKVSDTFPKKMSKKINEDDWEQKEANTQEEVIELLKDGFSHVTKVSPWITVFFIFNIITLFGTLLAVDFFNLGFEIGLFLFTLTSLSFGPLLALIMLEMDENDGFTALKIVLVVTMLTGFIGYSDFYSFSENKIFGAFLLIALLGLLLFNLARFFISISRPTVRAGAIFGAVLFSLFLLYDFNYIKQREDLVSNNWETALEMAFILYLDINTQTFNGIKNGFSSLKISSSYLLKKYSIDQITELRRLFKSKDYLSKENKMLKEQLDESYLNNFVISREKSFFYDHSSLNKIINGNKFIESYSLAKLKSFNPNIFNCCDKHRMYIEIIQNSNKDIKEGAVFNESGIIGQIVNNKSFYEVMLLTDTKSSIPLTNSKGDFYCNALGSGESGYITCSYNQLVWSDDHELGEKFFSSGLGGIYPKGIEIGNLESKQIIDPSTTLLKIKLISNPLHSNLFGVIKL